MISWATRRRFFYLGTLGAAVLLLVGVPFFLFTYKAPSCTDGRQNQGETGIDCGGSCVRICSSQALPPIVLWSQVFKVSNGFYNAVAYVENPNTVSSVSRISYSFKVYDDRNILLYERHGETFIPAGKRFPVFEGGIVTDKSIPNTVFFEFTETPDWQKVSSVDDVLSASNPVFTNSDRPRLEADITNSGILPVTGVQVVGILFDRNDNAIGASATVVDRISANGSAHVTFTWPQSFTVAVARIAVIPRLSSLGATR